MNSTSSISLLRLPYKLIIIRLLLNCNSIYNDHISDLLPTRLFRHPLRFHYILLRKPVRRLHIIPIPHRIDKQSGNLPPHLLLRKHLHQLVVLLSQVLGRNLVYYHLYLLHLHLQILLVQLRVVQRQFIQVKQLQQVVQQNLLL